MKEPRPYRGGFWDWVRKPSYRRWASEQAEKWFRRRNERRTLSDREIQSRVIDLWNPDQHDEARHDLGQQGERAIPALIAALQERSFEPRRKGEPYSSDEHPLKSILDLLGDLGAREALPKVLPFATHADKDFRKWAIRAMARTGSEDSVEHVIPALWDSDDWLPSSTMLGILNAIREDRADEGFVSALYQEIVKLVETGSNNPLDHSCEVLLEINREDAARLLLSDAIFRADRRDLYTIIEQLAEAEVTIPGDKLKRVMSDVKTHVAEYPQRYIYGKAILTLARQGDPEAETLAREAAEWGIERVSEDAAQAVAELKGLDDLWTSCCERGSASGIEALNTRQRHFYACQYFDFEVCNGGIAQYYANASGIHADVAFEGFMAISLNEVAGILKRSMELFGSDGPSDDWRVLERQLSRLDDADFAIMDKLSSDYFDLAIEARIRTHLYAADHAAEMLA